MRTKLKRALFGVMAGIMVANTPLTTLAAYTPANEPDDTTGHSAETASDKEAKKGQEEKSILEQKDLYTYLGKMEEEDRKKILADLTDEQTYELVILLQYEYLDTFNQEQSLELYKETVDGYWKNIPELKTDEEKKEYESKLSDWKDTAFKYVDTEEKDQESYLKSVFEEKSYGKDLYQTLTEYVDEKDDAEKQAEFEEAYESLKAQIFSGGGINQDTSTDKKETPDSKDETSDTIVDDKESKGTDDSEGTEKKDETVETPDQSENEQEPEQKDEQNKDSAEGTNHTTADNTDSSEETAEDLTLTKKELKSLMNDKNFDVKKFMKREYESRNFYPIYAGIKSAKKESFLADRTPEELYQIMLMSKYTLLQQYVKYAGMTIEKSDMSDLTAYLSDYQMILEQQMEKGSTLSEEQKQQLETEVLDVITKADKLENIDSLAGYEEYLKQLDVKIDMTGLLDMFGKVDLTSEDTLLTTIGDLLNYSYQLFGMEEEMNGEEVTPKPVISSRRKARSVMAASTTPSNGSEVAIANGAYYITAYTTNQALQVDNNGTADKTNVCLWPTNGSGYNRCEQKWIILRQSDGWYKILSNWSRKSLDVYGGGTGNGQNINLYTDNNSNSQRWKFYYYDGRYVIKSKLGTVVDVPNGDFSNGKNVQTWGRNNSAAQQWKLTKITNDTIYLKPGNSTNGHGYLASAPINNMANAYQRIQYTGGTIYVMGSWNVTSTVTLTSTSYANSAASGVNLLSGCSLSFKRYSGFKGNLIIINSSAGNATFKNLTFDGNRSAVQKTISIIAKSTGKLYLSNCTFQNNDAYNNAAAVWIVGNYNTTFDKCTFKNNKSYRDIVTNSDGSGNCTSTVWIQGDSNSNGTATFNDCIIENNTDQSAVTIIGAVGYFNRCTFTKNTNTSNDGYAAAIGFNAGDGYLNGCTFDGNSASKDGGVIHVNNAKGFSHADNRGHLEAKDCIFKNNSAGTNAGVIMLWHTYQNDKFDGCQFLFNSSGGGTGSVYIGQYSQATFTNNIFSNNTAKGGGGAISEGSGYGTVSLTATGNTFTNNSSGTRGGAIYTATKANISNNEFTGNTTGKNGGAVAVFSSSSGTTDTIKNNTFTNNSVPTTDTTNGGAVVIASGKAEFSQNIYKGNKATWGGAVDVQASATATLINETMSDNYGKGEGGAIHNNGIVTITAGLFENNSTGDDGGGAICNTGTLTMNSDSSYDSPGVFRNNTATTFGGAVYSKDQSGSKSTKIVSNGMQYENNTAGSSGGAVAVVFRNSASEYTAALTGNTFKENKCEGGSGGAVDVESGITGTLSNNTYESNTAKRGGALYNGGTTTLTDETMESNTVSDRGIGGAIDNEGTLTVNNGYFVNNSSDMYGGAVYTTGSLTLKKNASGTTTGEFIDNSATDAGGAVYNKMVSQYIDCTVNSTGITYSGNTAAHGGAVYANEYTTFTSNGDTFESNEASVEGGAVNILSRGEFIMNNGSMKGNTAPKGSGVSTDGIFRMSGSAVINPDEDVYLYPSRYISVPAALTSNKVATVTPSDYTTGRVVVSNSYSEKGSVLEPKFTLTPKAGYFLRGGNKNGANDTDVVISENYPVTYDCGKTPNPTGHFSDGTNLDDEDVKEWGVDYELRTDKPTAKGYLFSGWNTEEDGSGDDYFPGDTYSENEALYLYAQWTPIKYTVAYNGNGSTSGSMLTQTFTYGKSYNLAANGFVRSNYHFAGWNTKADGSGTSYSDKQSVKNLATKNGTKVTLYAQWAKNTYTIRFHANGGSGSMADVTVPYDTVYSLPKNQFTLKGYQFDEWIDADHSMAIDDEGNISRTSAQSRSDVVDLYAQWTPNEYYVAYNSNKPNGATGNISGTMAKSNHEYDTSNNLKANGYRLTGWTFQNWNTKADGSGTSYTDKQSVTNLTATNGATVTLYAQWKANTYTVKYDGNGSTGGSTASSSHTYDTAKALTANGFTKTGYTFKGWNTKSDGSGTVYTNKASVKNLSSTNGATITLYAQWTANKYTVAYNANGGSGTMAADTATYGSGYVTKENAFSRTGYTFKGWNEKADGTGTDWTNWIGKSWTWTYTKNITLYAQWTANQYQLTLNPNNGSFSDGTTAVKTLKPDLIYNGYNWCDIGSQKVSRTGYTFDGWYDKASGGEKVYDVNGSCVTGTYWKNNIYQHTGNLTVYAHWTAKNVTVTFHRNTDSNDTTTSQQTFTYDVAGQKFTDKGWSKTGYTLLGWSTDKNAANASYSVTNGVSNDWINKNSPKVDLYGVWTANKYTVAYNANDGSGTMATDKATYGAGYVTKANAFSRTGYTFVGWNEKADGTGTDWTSWIGKSWTWTYTKNITLYAQWTVNKYTLTITGDSGVEKITGNGTYNYGTIANVTYQIKPGYHIKNITGTTADGDPNGVWTGHTGKGGTVNDTWTVKACNRTAVVHTEPNTYTIKYDGNGSTGGSTANSSHIYDAAKALTANEYTRTGYSFNGWNTKADGSGTAYADKASVKNLTSVNGAIVILYAQWSINSYTLTYNPNGGSVSPTSKSLTYNSAYGTLPTPTRKGYAFTGWFTAASGGTKVSESTKMGTGNITIYAHWRANVLRVNYYPNGATKVDNSAVMDGSGVSTITPDAQYRYDDFNYDATMPSYGLWDARRFIRTGYTSTNKYHLGSKDGTVLLDAGNNVFAKTQDLATAAGVLSDLEKGDVSISIYVDWKANTYTVKYNGNGNTGGSTAGSSHTYDTAKGLTANGFTKTGYTFKNWNTKADGSGTSYADKASVKNLTATNGATVTLYAQWTANKYTVTYNANGGTGTMANQELTYDKAAALNANTFKRTGYRFNGWNTKADGTGTSYADKASVKNLTANSGGTVTLYAKWYSAAPELEAKDATYYEGQDITKTMLLKNVTKASDVEDGDMAGKVIITKIEYSAGKLADGKPQAAYTKSWTNGMPDSEKLDTWFQQLPKEKAPVTHKITYQVTDLSGKTTTKTSTITVKYNEFPVIKAEDRYFTLEEAKAGKITKDVLLKEAIASGKLKAEDKEDGVISNKVTILDYKDTDFKNVNGNATVTVIFKVNDSMGPNGVGKETVCEVKVKIIDSGSDYWRDDDGTARKQVRFITQKYYDKNKDTDFHGMTSEEIEASSDNGGLNVMSKWYQNAAYKALLTGSFAKDAGTDYKISAEKAKELKQKIESNGIGNSKSSNALTDIYNSLK